jgi:hypothetical protein
MPDPIHVPRIIHTIHATTDIYGMRCRYQDALGGLVFAENYFPAEDRDCALLYVTDHMIEPMAPRNPEDLDKPFARMTRKIGEAFHSFELKVEDGPAAAKAFEDAGCKVASNYGVFFFVRPESTGGVLLEVCETPMPNDPYDRPHWDPKVGAGHGCGVTGLDHIACVTGDMDQVLRFFTELVDGTVKSDELVEAPQPARRVLIRIGDTDVAFLQPINTEFGPLAAFLKRKQNGIYALVWKIEDEDKARRHFMGGLLNMRLTEEDCVSSGFAIHPDDFFGGRHEFLT